MGAPSNSGGYLNAPVPSGAQGGSHAVAKKRTVVPRVIATFDASGQQTAGTAYARVTNPSGRLMVGMSVCFEATDGESLAFGTSTWQARAGRKNNQNGRVAWGPNIFPAARTLPDAWSFEDSTEEVLCTFALANEDFGGAAGQLVMQVTFEATNDMSPQEADSLLAQVDVVVGAAPVIGCDSIVEESSNLSDIQIGAKTAITFTFGSPVTLLASNSQGTTYINESGVTKAGSWNHTIGSDTSATWIFTPTDNWTGDLVATSVVFGTGICAQSATESFCPSIQLEVTAAGSTIDGTTATLTFNGGDDSVWLGQMAVFTSPGLVSVPGSFSPSSGYHSTATFTPTSSPMPVGNYVITWTAFPEFCGQQSGTTAPFAVPS